MQTGAMIQAGLKDWQIVQQREGNAFIHILGTWSSENEIKNARVFARIVKEDTGDTVIPWSYSDDLSNQKHKKGDALAPDIEKVIQMDENQVKMKFVNVQNRLYAYEVPVSKTSFRVEDENGEVKIASYEMVEPNIIILNLDRAITGKGYVHNAYGMNPEGIIPVDYATHLPILAFYKIPITRP